MTTRPAESSSAAQRVGTTTQLNPCSACGRHGTVPLHPRVWLEKMEGGSPGPCGLRLVAPRRQAGGTPRVTHRCHHRKELKHRSWSIAGCAPRYLGSPVHAQLYFSPLCFNSSPEHRLPAAQPLPVAEGPPASRRVPAKLRPLRSGQGKPRGRVSGPLGRNRGWCDSCFCWKPALPDAGKAAYALSHFQERAICNSEKSSKKTLCSVLSRGKVQSVTFAGCCQLQQKIGSNIDQPFIKTSRRS